MVTGVGFSVAGLDRAKFRFNRNKFNILPFLCIRMVQIIPLNCFSKHWGNNPNSIAWKSRNDTLYLPLKSRTAFTIKTKLYLKSDTGSMWCGKDNHDSNEERKTISKTSQNLMKKSSTNTLQRMLQRKRLNPSKRKWEPRILQLRKCGKPSIRENLVVTWPYARPSPACSSVHTTGKSFTF